jgi:hypothetical protein
LRAGINIKWGVRSYGSKRRYKLDQRIPFLLLLGLEVGNVLLLPELEHVKHPLEVDGLLLPDVEHPLEVVHVLLLQELEHVEPPLEVVLVLLSILLEPKVEHLSVLLGTE